MLSNGSALTYDAENRLTSATQTGIGTMDYHYDGAGRRVQEVSTYNTEKLFIYDAFSRLSAEYSVGMPAPPCATCYIAADHLGSTRLVTDQNGNTVGRHDYVPFGEEIAANTGGRDSTFGTSDFVNQKFTGQERDAETGLDFFHARYFSGALGRFNSPDPDNVGADLFTPQSWNGYTYAYNNPLTLIDPSGMFADGRGPMPPIDGCIWDSANGALDCGGTSYPGCVSYGTQGCIPPPCSATASGCDNPPPPGAPYGGGGGGGGGKGAAAEPPKNDKRPEWVNNITSIFGYDQRINLPSCAAIAFGTALDDLNPFSPGTFGEIKDGVKGTLMTGQLYYFNAAISHAAARGLTYPNKSSIFRGSLKTSSNLGKAAGDYLAPAAIDAGLLHGFIREMIAMSRGECQ